MFFVLASFTHNSVILLVGHWLEGKKRAQLGWIVMAVGVSMLPLVLGIVAKSRSATGANTTLSYVGFFVITALVVCYGVAGRGILRPPFSVWRNYLVILPLIFVLGEAQFERVSMLFVIAAVVAVFRYHETWRIRWALLANAMYFVLIAPVFLFPSAFEMLRT